VGWEDSSTLHGWTSQSEKGRTGKIVSLGFVHASDRSCLTLTTSIADNGDGMSPISIPWKCIRFLEEVPTINRNSNLPK